ncbi:DNA polymerase subunit gamma-1 [Leucoagaricus sp. SymC.cos]|nr:DNA polymerase subunit gamma-1 [Leucoagaricus sp. SymC.cos]
MLRPISNLSTAPIPPRQLSRYFNSSSVDASVFRQKPISPAYPASHRLSPQRLRLERQVEVASSESQPVERPQKKPKRNEVGVQLLSRQLHSQLFRDIFFTPPSPAFVQIAKEHLEMHNLDPALGSQLPDIGFRLPPLQGANLDEHFYRLGSHAAEPWLQQAKTFSSIQLPPKPEYWEIRSGWTKYTYVPDGASYCEPVDFPSHEGKSEQMLAFDVETLPKYHPYAIMACAATSNAWYTWISPWLLEETEDPNQLIPIGDSKVPRVVVGHNVSYDRARVLEEYNVEGTANRFLDTMALHVAVTGISSHQRPEWMKYRKSKEKHVSQLSEDTSQLMEEESEVTVEKRWEELTSANSLRDVAKLHCGISLDKEIRNDFMTSTPQDIRDNVSDYLDYCCSDVEVTHKVYAVVLPAFLQACPHPVSFAGVLGMGSSFLTVNQEWERYLERAEGTYRQMDEGVKQKLKEIAEGVREFVDMPEAWQQDPWLSQLDWTPKVAGKSRGINTEPVEVEIPAQSTENGKPAWYMDIQSGPLKSRAMERILPLLLKLSYRGYPVRFSSQDKWHYLDENGEIARFETAMTQKASVVLYPRHAPKWIEAGLLSSVDLDLAERISRRDKGPEVEEKVLELAEEVLQTETEERQRDPWLSQLDWSMVSEGEDGKRKRTGKPKPVKPPPVYWPKWYWEATKPKKDMPPGTLDITVRNRIAPLLLRLSWLGWPLFHSREHGWTFRVPFNGQYTTRSKPLSFYDDGDKALADMSNDGMYQFHKLPHKDGEKANVGSPLGKTFIKYAQDGTLQSPGEEAKEALDMNVQCSYWIGARDRIINQMVVWQNGLRNLGFSASQSSEGNEKWGIIIPQVITMGAVTRRAIEKTWLTASNAKKNRVGSELKAMIRAPEGCAIVGADVDSEELWISSCMGDAQFGLHGATALGWMTLEGTKVAGTDLHSKTASILGISRDAAKVFNYSRIYGAGQRHAVLLLLQNNPSMEPEQAQKLAQNLYASTKGKNTHRSDIFKRKFWFGGSESFVFNKLEEIALSDNPQTPALGCGITHALSKKYLPETFGSDYMTSRINWVVQSSGVDYLHLLIVSMQHLIEKYNIQARYLISVHDELRYLVKEEDKYRAALALQISNLWTRCLFAYKLGMDDLPQGVAFFSAVDVDHVLRKEVDMPCVTPSQPNPIPPGESLDITKVLDKTNGGTLIKDESPMPAEPTNPADYVGHLDGYVRPHCLAHRSKSAAFLRAQATADFNEIKGLAGLSSGKKSNSSLFTKSKSKKRTTLGNGNIDWSDMVERLLRR